MSVEILMNQGVQAFGMSITTGSLAVNSVNYWVNRLNAYIGGTAENRAIGGTGFPSMVSQAYTYMPYGGRTKLVVIDGPLNDVRQANTGVLPSVKPALDAMLSTAFGGYIRGAAWPAPNVVRTGTWNNLSTTYRGRSNFFSQTPMYTSDPDASITFQFTGPVVALHGFASEMDDWLDVEIEIDGEYWGTTNWAGTARPGAGKQAVATVIDGLDNTAHTLVVRPPSTGIPVGHYCVVDCIQCPYSGNAPAIVGGIPDIKDWTAYGSVGTWETAQSVNEIIKQVVDEWKDRGYCVSYADVPDFVAKNRDYTSDGVHPTDRGHLNWALAYLSQVRIKP